MSRRASPQVPAGLLGDGRPGVSGRGDAAAVVTAPAQTGAIRAAGRRGRGRRRVGRRPQSEHRGGGLIFVELFGGRLGREGGGREREGQLLSDFVRRMERPKGCEFDSPK